MVVQSARYQFIFFYVVFLLLLIIIVPYFGAGMVDVTAEQMDSMRQAPSILDPLGLIDRFFILVTVSSENIFLGIIFFGMSIVMILILIEMFIEVLPF